MRISEPLLTALYPEGKAIRRACWPKGDHISSDGAAKTLWYWNDERDDLTPDYRLDFEDLGANDWEIVL